MASRLVAVSFAALEPERLVRFWGEFLRWEPDGLTLLPVDDTGFGLGFVPTEEPKRAQNRAHFDLTSTSLEDQQHTVARALDLGARHVDVGQRPDEPHVVLADPEGNEFCVIEPGNKFLADCGVIGALACDGSQEVGYFWSAALGWPLMWDQNEETAIRSPHGGPKITWGGPPLMPRVGSDRVRFELEPQGDRQAELERLVSLGATPDLTDPDGNAFSLT
ncbi:VOC family protein [Cryptosporangium sp. NPDC048952]|uniref:VOC family protein n=1 Tax=Cryptosporangium sp. NPDC048952 TaxID=3363961 RepID=UPI00371CA717